MTTTTTTPPAEQPEPIPAPVEPPSAPAPEAPEPPVNEATQPMDAVTADPSAQMTPIERFGSPMVVTAQPQPTIEDLQKRIAALERDLERSERARKHLEFNTKKYYALWQEAMRAIGTLNANRDRTVRRAKAYRAEISKANHHTANQTTIIAMQKAEVEAARKQAETPTVPTDWRLKLDTAQQRIDQQQRDLEKAQRRITDLEHDLDVMRESRDHYRRMYSREMEWRTHYKPLETVGTAEAAEPQKEAAQ